MTNLTVPFLDLKAQYESIRPEMQLAINSVLERQIFVLGDEVAHLELELAQYLGVKHVITLNSGTDALIMSLKVLGIGPGDEVITQPNSFIATTLAITEVGATPIFVDIDEATMQIDTKRIESAITKKTKAILPVHLFGAPCEMDKIVKIAKAHNLFVVEDAAQSFGSSLNGKHLGSYGNLSALSFYPGKNLGAYGDGGAIATSDSKLYEKLLMLRNYGQEKKYHHVKIGLNSRLDEIQAAVLRVKLRHIDEWNIKRNEHALFYGRNISHQAQVLSIHQGGVTNYHIYPIRLSEQYRDKLMDHLVQNDIHTLIHYPLPIHLQKCYAYLGFKRGDFPNSEKAAKEMISLPMFAEMNQSQRKHVCEVVSRFLLSCKV